MALKCGDLVGFQVLLDRQGFSPGQIDGKTWSIPFQRSTIVLYWNKDAFKEAGLDPDKAPAS